MQQFDQARTLFYMQSELIDTKIDSSVNKSINRVIEQIVSLRQEIHKEIGALSQRLSAVEAALGRT